MSYVGMKTPRFAVSSLAPRALVAFWLVGAASARACINGHDLHPERLRRVKPDVFPPKLAPLKAEDFKAVRPLEVPRPEMPNLAPAPIAFEALAVPLPFAAFAAKFEATRMAPANRTYERRIDYSVALIRLGRVKDAIVELQALEKAFPGKYKTAANLGTAYELDGQLEPALEWIAKGIERNPDSHAGTEWLHVAILKAKLKLNEDPAWLATHSVLEGVDAPAEEVVRAIEYQLNERLVFVKPLDAVVCDLFYQAARRLDATQPGMAERRGEYLRQSVRYGKWRKDEVEQLLKG